MFKHSLSVKLFCNSMVVFVVLCLMFVGLPRLSQAQMFSVGGDKPDYNVPQTEFTLGLESTSVTYKGGNNTALFEFEGPIIRLGYNTRTLNLFLGTAGSVTGVDDVAYFDVGGNINFNIRLYRSQKVAVRLPVRISSRYVNMTNDEVFQPGINNYFRFGSLTPGAGAELLVRPSDDIRVAAGVVPSYGFAFASGGFFGGSLGSVAAHGRLYFDRFWGDVGLSIGYEYDLRNYDIDNDSYDYKINGHLIELGITF